MNSKKLSDQPKKEPIKTQSNNVGLLRGFGLRYDCKTGRVRNWYWDKNGVQRWVDNDAEVMA